jgi:SAM-dependent methyltransferase
LVFAIKQWLDRKLFRKLLARIPGETLAVLDVGGGAGEQIGTVRAADSRITTTQIVDLDPNAAALARAGGHHYFCGRVEDFHSGRPFDLVLLLNLIEHVDDPGLVLKRIRSLLAPGGLVLVKTPNHDALDARIFRHQSWAGYHCPRHWVLFTRDSFQSLAEKAGLSVREFSYTQGAPFWAASVLFWLARRRIVSITRDRPVFYHPLFGLFSAGFAAVDFIRRPFAKTSQMFFVLGHQR